MNSTPNKNNSIIILLSVSIVIAIGVFYLYQNYYGYDRDNNIVNASQNIKYKKTVLKIDNIAFETFVADTSLLREQGLSNWSLLLPNQAMLFVFDNDGKHSFWMKDMNFPIDIVWLDKDFNIVHIERNLKPETYPETFVSSVLARYVLELPAGTMKENSVVSK